MKCVVQKRVVPGLRRWAGLAALLAGLGLSAAEPAPDARHWALEPLRTTVAPASGHPVDAFVQAALREQGLEPSPPASDRELVRRLYFDLIGLPPTPAEVESYLADTAPDRFSQLVDRLLASPRYGERWARHWLDVVRFTESQGFEYDRPRDHAWHYRDYVIRSFNTDKPYDRFMREQVAGDVLEPVTRDGIIGAGLLVAGPWDQAGNSQANATQRAITREEELEDLVSVVGQTFLGLTINCARCHDHKFDPIPLADYYRVKAVFEGVRHGDRPVEGEEERRTREARAAELQAALRQSESALSRVESAVAKRLAAARSTGTPEPGPVALARWVFGQSDPATPSGTVQGGARLGAAALELPVPGAFFEGPWIQRDLRAKTLEAWVALDDLKQGGGAAISLERKGGGSFDAIVFGERQPGKWMVGSEGFTRTRDVDGPAESTMPGAWIHVAAVFAEDNTVALYRNGEPYGKPYPVPGLATFKAGEARVVLGRRHEGGGRPWLTGAIQRAALYDRALTPAEVAASHRASGPVLTQAEILAALGEAERTERDAAIARIAELRQKLKGLDRSGPLAYVGTRSQPSPTRVLKRGDVKNAGEVVAPAGLAAIRSIPADLGLAPDAPEAQRRLRFADWLCSPSNPLPARVVVNRVWHFHFGLGLVATPSDFGRGGTPPTHPELLDWLAADFIRNGWSLKSLHRQIVTSATYRQASNARPEGLARDADNRWLWRFTPRRLEAEAVRDAMLAVGGNLNLQEGGPSFRPFTTSEYGATFYHLFDKGDPEYNRRTIYRMNINSGKDPMLDAFDCPDPSVKTPRRGVTTTPLQALSLMNGSFVQRQAAGLAARAAAIGRSDVGASVDAAYRIALGRPATPVERKRGEEAARRRGLSSVCWALLNTTEFVYVR